MIRIAQIVGQMNGGGVEAVVMNYYRHIDRNRVQFDFIVDSNSAMIPDREIEQLGGRVFTVSPITKLASHKKELMNLFRSGDWKIVHSHRNALSPIPLWVAKDAGIPIRIAHSHSTSGKGEIAKNVLKSALKPFSSCFPTHKLACSKYAGEWLFGRNSDFEVLYNAIDLDKYAFSSDIRNEVRNELMVPEDAFLVGHVGRFMPQKNHRFLLESFAELLSVRKNAKLVLVGDGEYRHQAEKWVSNKGMSNDVLFLGQRSDVNRLYQAFDVFALPSLYEGLCLVGVEAQRSGLPCIMSDAITREVDLTGNIQFLPIDDPGLWALRLSGLSAGSRIDVSPESFRQYDISTAAVWLTNYYLRLYDTCEEGWLR